MYLPVCALAVLISSNQGRWYAASVCKFRVAILPFYCSNSFIDLLGLGFILLNLAVVYIYRCKQRSFGQSPFKESTSLKGFSFVKNREEAWYLSYKISFSEKST